jgi:hypothetical protein
VGTETPSVPNAPKRVAERQDELLVQVRGRLRFIERTLIAKEDRASALAQKVNAPKTVSARDTNVLESE